MKLPLTFEMTTTLEEFRRRLPAAVGNVSFLEENGAFVHREDGRSWRIGLELLAPLQAGVMQLERYRVDFQFAGYAEREIEDFMARFEMYFRRGGG